MPRTLKPRNIPCPVKSCDRLFSNRGGLTTHIATKHTILRHARRHRAENHASPPGSPPRFDSPDIGEGGMEDPGDAEGTQEQVELHPLINGLPCDVKGQFLPKGSPPPPWDYPPTDDFSPYDSRASFELADLLYRRDQMPSDNINDLLQIWAATQPSDKDPPFANTADLYETIDSTDLGDIRWQSFTVHYDGEVHDEDAEKAPWKLKGYDVWFRDPLQVLRHQLKNPSFAKEMDFCPKRVFDRSNKRRYRNFMSGNWSWRQADIIAENPANHGAVFCPVIAGSDKTTVSVATGQTEYYPLYISNGLIHNNVRRAHRNGLTLIGFLAIAKTDRQHKDSDEFRRFRRRLFHGSLREIFESLRPGMETPEIVRFGDGHYRRVIYGLGPYIADYPEQVLLGCIVQGWCGRCTARFDDLDGIGGRRTHELTETLFETLGKTSLWDDYGIVADIMPYTHSFPRADIHELLAPDLLHQIIKGTFKDHLVTWVNEYIELVNTPAEAARILADIDQRIAVVPPFAGLRRFPEGRGFKQWTGDDSKALMKVYLPAISGHVPAKMVEALKCFLEFCSLVRRSVLDEDDLEAIDEAVAGFHRARVVFEELGVRPDGFSLPRQHSLVHYRQLIQEFGAPNGLCSSITESKHIKAVKEPWRRSSRFEAMKQMLETNQRLDKLAASRVDFRARGMLQGSIFTDRGPPPAPPEVPDAEDDDGGAVESDEVLGEVTLSRKPVVSIPRDAYGLSHYLNMPKLPDLLSRFLYEKAHPDLDIPLIDVPLIDCPAPTGNIRVFPSAVATFYAPSDKSGIGGMFQERIRAVPSWRKGPARYDCVFVTHDETLPGFQGLHVARVLLLFSFAHERKKYPCALVTWFSPVSDEPCPETGMWIVRPDTDHRQKRIMSVIHIDSILRGAHLIGRAGVHHLPKRLEASDSLDAFHEFYVNKYIDHHAHEIAF